MFMLVQNDHFLGFRRGVFDPLHQLGGFKAGFGKKVAVGIPKTCKIYRSGKKFEFPTIIVDMDTHIAVPIGDSLIPDPELIEVLGVSCEEKLWKYYGSVNLETWQMLALMGAGAGILGGIQLILNLIMS